MYKTDADRTESVRAGFSSSVARLALVDAAKTVIANALNIMGIAAPERM